MGMVLGHGPPSELLAAVTAGLAQSVASSVLLAVVLSVNTPSVPLSRLAKSRLDVLPYGAAYGIAAFCFVVMDNAAGWVGFSVPLVLSLLVHGVGIAMARRVNGFEYERGALQREREALLQRVVEVEWRRRIADYLRDVVVEELAGVAPALSEAASQVGKRGTLDGDSELTGSLDRLATEIRSVVKDLRAVIISLASPTLVGTARQAAAGEAPEADVRRIAGDLHDGVVQDLAGILFELRAEASRLRNDEAVRDDELVELVEACAAQIRATMKDLRTLGAAT